MRATIAAGVDHVAAASPVLAALVDQHPRPRFAGRRNGTSRFEELAESICYQQLAGKAAASIWAKVKAAVGPSFTPEAVLGTGYDALRAAGFSNAKATSVLDLAEHVHRGDVRLDRIGRLSDQQIVDELVVVRGIGRWTAEMFLMFTLGRLDVWPTGDYGVRAGWARAHGLPALPKERELEPLGDDFRPYRSIVAWYCWRAVEA